MAGQPWTDAEIAHVRKRVSEGASDRQVGRELGRSADSVGGLRKRENIPGGRMVKEGKAGALAALTPGDDAPPESEERLEKRMTSDSATLFSLSRRIRTLEQLLEVAEMDASVWEVTSWEANQWEVGAKVRDADGVERVKVTPVYQIKAKFGRNRKACVVDEIGKRVLANIEAARPDWPESPPVVLPRLRDRFLWEVCFMDLHIGKLAWEPESGADYDSEIAETVFKEALEELIGQVQGRAIEEIVVPIGNDLLQIDNLERTTTSGTPQDTDTRFAKMFVRAEKLERYKLERLSAIAPVRGKIVPGNHDRQSVFTLGRVLHAWFQGNERVDIDVSPRLRKYHRYGVNLIGYTHGSEEKPADLPLIMAQECGRDWAETRFREWHVGHLHKMKETRYTAGDSFNGVRVRIIPSLCAADAWHYMKGYVGEVRSAEAYLWNKRTGYAGHQAANVLDGEGPEDAPPPRSLRVAA